jgi:hypothetical protein
VKRSICGKALEILRAARDIRASSDFGALRA